MPGGENDRAAVVDLVAEATASQGRIAWSRQSQDLNVNLIVLDPGQAIEPHRNHEVDVLLVGVEGEGSVEVDGDLYWIAAGQAMLISKGAERAIRSVDSRFAYLTCHGMRRGIQPQVRRG